MLRDASEKEMVYKGPSMQGSGMKEEVTFQKLCFTPEQLPEIKSWEVGSRYLLTIEVEMKEHSTEMDEGEIEEEAEFEVLRVGVNEAPDSAAKKMAQEKIGPMIKMMAIRPMEDMSEED